MQRATALGIILLQGCAPRAETATRPDHAVWEAIVAHACPDINGPCKSAIVKPSVMPGLSAVEWPIVTTAREFQKEFQLTEDHLVRFLPGCPGEYACNPPPLPGDTLPVPPEQPPGFCHVGLELSQIAYSNDGRMALVTTRLRCYPMGGHDNLVLLRRGTDGTWRVLKDALLQVE